MQPVAFDSLGHVKIAWKPGSLLRDANAGKNLPFWFMPVQTVVVLGSLFLCISAAAVVYVQLLKPMNLSPGILWGGLVFVALFIPPMVLLNWLGQRLVNRNELAVHDKGVRWANNCVRFDQIDSLSMGTETFREKHFPVLNELWKLHWRHGEGMKKAEELEKRATLAFHLKDGSVAQWRNLGQCFSEETMQAFFDELAGKIGDEGGTGK